MAPASDSELHVQRLTWPEFAATWGTRWDDVLTACGEPNPFLTFAWLRAWWNAFGQPGAEEILLVPDASGAPVGGAFLQRGTDRYGGLPLRTLRPWVNNHCHRAGLLARRDAARPVAQALLQHCTARRREWALLRLEGVAADHPLWDALQEAARTHRCTAAVRDLRGSTWVAADRPWPDYYGALHAKTRAGFERKVRRLQDLGACDWQRYAGGEALPALEHYLELERRSWKSGGGEVVLDHPHLARFYRDAVGGMAAAGQCAVHLVTLAAQPVSAVVTLEHAGRVFTYKTSFDAAHARLSPGWLAYRHVLEDAFARGAEGVDLLASAPYTRHWGLTEHTVGDLWLFSPTVVGHVARCAWRLRQALTARKR